MFIAGSKGKVCILFTYEVLLYKIGWSWSHVVFSDTPSSRLLSRRQYISSTMLSTSFFLLSTSTIRGFPKSLDSTFNVLLFSKLQNKSWMIRFPPSSSSKTRTYIAKSPGFRPDAWGSSTTQKPAAKPQNCFDSSHVLLAFRTKLRYLYGDVCFLSSLSSGLRLHPAYLSSKIRSTGLMASASALCTTTKTPGKCYMSASAKALQLLQKYPHHRFTLSSSTSPQTLSARRRV